MLEGNIRDEMVRAVDEYRQNTLTLPLASDAQQWLIEQIGEAAGREQRRDVAPTQREGRVAAANVARLLAEAERMARQSGEQSISRMSLTQALKGICPLFPFC